MESRNLVRLICSAVWLVGAPLLMASIASAAKQDVSGGGFYDSARELINKGDLRGAIIELKNALQQDPGDLSARILLGQTYLKVEDSASAAKELLRARRDGAQDRFILVPLGQAYLRHGLYNRLLKEVRTAGQDAATAAKIHVIRGNAYLGIQEYEDAEKSYVSALKSLPSNEKALVGMARLKLGVGDFSAAKRYVKWTLEANTRNADAWFMKGEIARLQRDKDGALTGFNRAIEYAPDLASALMGRGGLLIALNRHNEAERDIVKVRKKNPRLARAAYLHYLILTHRGERQKAQEALADADLLLKSFPPEVVQNHPPTMLLSGIVSYFMGNKDTAYRHLTRYLERIPHHDGARRILATIALERGETSAALNLLAPIAAYLTKDIEFLNLYGDALSRSGRRKDAAKVLDAAAKLGKPGTPARFRTIMLYIAAGRDDQAIALLKTEISEDPKALPPALTLGATYMRQRNYDDALRVVGEAIKRHPRSPAIYNLKGGAELGKKDTATARASFQNAIDIDPDYLQAIFNLAKLEGGAGNVAAARKHFASILEKDPQNGDVMLTLSRLSLREKDIVGAVRWLEKARTSSRDSKKATNRLINLHLDTGSPDKALVLAQQLHQEEPGNFEYLAALGRTQMSAKRLELASRTFQQLANQAFEAKSLDWLRRVSVWQQWVRDIDAAKHTLQRALEIDEKYIPAQFELFRLELSSDNFDAASARAEKVVILVPQVATGQIMRGDVFMRKREFSSAVRVYGDAFAKAPSTPLATKLYQARRASGRRALSFVVDWAKKRKGDDDALRLLAVAYADSGKNQEAVRRFRRLLNKSPKDADLLNNIAVLYQRLGDKRALGFAKRALDATPNRPAFMDTYGWLLVQNGEAAKGLRILRNAQLRAPDSPSIQYHIAVALNALGRKKQALHEVRAVIESGRPFDGIGEARQLLVILSAAGH